MAAEYACLLLSAPIMPERPGLPGPADGDLAEQLLTATDADTARLPGKLSDELEPPIRALLLASDPEPETSSDMLDAPP